MLVFGLLRCLLGLRNWEGGGGGWKIKGRDICVDKRIVLWRALVAFSEGLEILFFISLELSICSQSSDLNFFISAIVLVLTNVQQTSTHGLETPL